MTDRISLAGFLIGGLLLGLAAVFADSWAAVSLATIAILCFVAFGRMSRRPARDFFAGGIVFSTTAFYWIPETITLFGGFPSIVAHLVFALFVSTSALQFAAAGWLYGRFRSGDVDEHWLFLPVAWIVFEMIFPRLFPWGLAHNFLAWKSFSSLAGVCGEYPLSFLVLVWAALAVDTILLAREEGGVRHGRLLLTSAVIALPLIAGAFRNVAVSDETRVAPRVKIGLVQGNLHALKGANVMMLSANLETYASLSKRAVEAGAELLVWPESVMNVWTPTGLKTKSLRGTNYDPFPQGDGSLIYGTMSFQEKSPEELRVLKEQGLLTNRENSYHRYNSAMLSANGVLREMYHKRTLMPFGEYMPLASVLPFLAKLSPMTGNLTRGEIVMPLSIPENVETGTPELRIGTLICYEDLVPRLSREYLLFGSNLLVNLTNDAWYGKSHAPLQHHMLAAWRAIETGRTLVRGTNTGYSAVVDPTGETFASIPMFQEGFAVVEAPILSGRTLYSRIGDTGAWLMLVFGIVAVQRARKGGLPE